MKLTFRGSTYTLDTAQTGVSGIHLVPTYRGHRYSLATLVPVATPANPLCYRGVSYGPGQRPSRVERPRQYPVSTLPTTTLDIKQLHQRQLLQNVQRRMEVAQSRGDQQLVRLLQAEMEQLAA